VNSMETTILEEAINELLDSFYQRRIDKISKLKLREALTRKNPYLYKAIGVENPEQIVREILNAYTSSSDEGIFGDEFFENLAIKVSGGRKAELEGVDLIEEDDTIFKAIAVKSGTNVFNADSRKRQAQNFKSLRGRMNKQKKYFDPVVGYCYGKKFSNGERGEFREISGQVFWEELTGNPNFYIEIIQIMNSKPKQHLQAYNKEFEDAVKRFTVEFEDQFCHKDGSINWEKLVEMNSSKPCKKLKVIEPKASPKILHGTDKLQIKLLAAFHEGNDIDITGSGNITYVISEGNLDVFEVTADGKVGFNENAQPGEIVKVEMTYYGKTISKRFKLANSKRQSTKQPSIEQISLF